MPRSARPVTRRAHAFAGCLLALAASAGCSSPSPAPAAPATPAAPAPAPGPSRAELLAAADARTIAPPLATGVSSADPSTRELATIALARLHDPSAYSLLARALRDPHPAVRDAASLGIGALEDRAPEPATAALLGALATEPDPALRAHHLDDLGRLATDEAVAAFAASLASDSPDERRGACRGVGAVALRSRNVAPELTRRVATRLVDDAAPTVRLACAYALSRLAPPDDPIDAAAVGTDLARALEDPDADVRAMSVRALARHPGASLERLAARVRDPDWVVAVHAFRTLARRAVAEDAAPTYAAELRHALDMLLAGGDVASGPPLHVFSAALEAAAPLSRAPSVHAFAQSALERLGRVPEDLPATRDRGLAHCAAARLVDLGRGWPSRVAQCGLEQVSDVERQVLAAEILAPVEGSIPQRGVALQRLLRHESARVRAAAISAMGALESPEALTAIVAVVESEEDVGVRIAALEALRTGGARRSERLAASILEGAPVVDDGWPRGAIASALRTAGRALSAENDLEGLVTWLAAARDLAPRELTPVATPLASHANLAVRLAARELLREADAPIPDEAPPAPSNALDARSIEGVPAAARAVLDTDRGPIVIELWPDRAPTTVLRFAELVRAGFYDGLTFHRVVPAFVVQGGDPRGDGYGGPGWSQRCEDSRAPYERGTVGMALAGRDTGGSQFFVTVSPQPHLDARYTAFGRVVEGMENVERLQAGDAIRSITLRAE